MVPTASFPLSAPFHWATKPEDESVELCNLVTLMRWISFAGTSDFPKLVCNLMLGAANTRSSSSPLVALTCAETLLESAENLIDVMPETGSFKSPSEAE